MRSLLKYEKLNKLRSYSAIFSRKSFLNLLQEDDYSFLDSNIVMYDYRRIGKSIYTYFDYITFTYNELVKEYRNEYVYKNIFINDLLINTYGVENTIAISEFRVGNSIADLVLFNGTSKAFEIKTEFDSDRRLKGQLSDYRKVFSECYIVTDEKLISKYTDEDESLGIISLKKRSGSITMFEVRKAKEKNTVDAETLMGIVRTSEYKNIIKQYYGYLPEMSSFNMFEKCKSLMKEIPDESLRNLFLCEMKKRKSVTVSIENYSKELRQLCLALNIDNSTYRQLEIKLNRLITV